MHAGPFAALTTVLAIAAGASAPAVAAATPQQEAHSARVVVIAVPDLRWADVVAMPQLQAWSQTAAAGELSVKTENGTPRCADGELTFNAGERADAGPVDGCRLTSTQFREFRADARSNSFAAAPGALGQALHRAGLRTAVVGEQARALLADETGAVDEVTGYPAALASADVVAMVDDELDRARTAQRAELARRLDSTLARQLVQAPAGVMVVVAGISDGERTGMHLHVLLIRGPGWAHRALRSPSTRAPFVQLRDLAPTLLSQLQVPVPSVMGGKPAFTTGESIGSPSSYADDDHHAVKARGVGRALRVVLGYAAVAVMLLFVAARWFPFGYRLGAGLAAVFVAAPAGSFLVQVLPWWRWSSWVFGILLAAFGVSVGIGVMAARRRSARLALLVAPALTAALLIGDQLAGAPLQLSAPLGDNPIIAGRFHGMGNTDFAFMCASVLLCAGCVAVLRPRRQGVLLAAGLCAIAVVVDAAPQLGDDFGGLLAMVPASVLLVVLLAGVRVTWRRLLVGAVGVVVFAVLVGLADYARPAEHQTHIGRFVGQILHGGAGAVIHRKLAASLGSFGSPAFTSVVGVLLIALIVDGHRLVATLRRMSGLPQAAWALVPLAVLGTALNDSGVVVGGSVVLIAALAVGASGVRPPDATEDHEDVDAIVHGSTP